MRRNKIISIMIAMLMAVTLSMPSIAFAQEENSVTDDRGQASVEKNINTKTVTTSSTEETPSTEFQYSKYNGKVTITRYVGTSAEVVIPREIEGFPVTSIGWQAFENCSSLSSITIPKGVTSIGSSAFGGCSNLISIKISEGVTSIGSSAFKGCSKLSYITIPKSITNIGSYAFSDCSSLSSITIPEGVKSIEDDAFYHCSSLRSITIPNGVTSIGSCAFHSCSSLSSITIPDSVTSIGSGAFHSCSSLSSITIPSGVRSIGRQTFRNCSSLNSITIPEGVTNIGYEAFSICSSLSSITIPEDVTSIGERAFSECSSLSSITIPEGVTSIGNLAFSGCSKLKDIKLPGSLVSIGNNAFSSSKKLIVYENSCGHEYAEANNISYEIDENEIKATSVTINKESLELELGEYFNLNVEVLPENTIQKWVRWTTDNRDVIKLHDNGMIVALKTGEATVTATTAHGLTATCHVTVTHVHEWNNGTVIQDVSCINDELTRYVCSGCSKSKIEVTKSATGHIYAEEYTSDDNTHWHECHCGAKTGEEAHNWHSDYRTIREANCTESGSKAIFCKDCDAKKVGSEVEIDLLGHAYGTVTIDPTCSQGGYDLHICGRCGDTKKDNFTPAKGHSFGDWQTIKNSSCTEEGSEQRTCNECEYTETRGVVKKEHNWETDYTIDKKATCTTDGSKSIHCNDCDAVKDSTVIEATGHDYSEWEVTKEPSCEEKGLSKRTCSKCHIEETLELAIKSHDWKGDYTIDKPATCTKDGSKSIHCRDCDAVKDSTVIAALGHNYSDYITDKKASFEADGIKESTCSKCSEKRTKTIPKAEQPTLSNTEYTYDGKVKEPKVTVKNSLGEDLVAGTDYDVTYKNNKYVGTATTTITGKGDYSGTVSKTFKINPPKTAITSLTKSKKAFTVKWTKKTAQVTGYQIMYARNSRFTSSKKTATVTSDKATSKKISKLSSKKKYYVKIRTYKTVKGVKYYSPWSNYKTVTTK